MSFALPNNDKNKSEFAVTEAMDLLNVISIHEE